MLVSRGAPWAATTNKHGAGAVFKSEVCNAHVIAPGSSGHLQPQEYGVRTRRKAGGGRDTEVERDDGNHQGRSVTRLNRACRCVTGWGLLTTTRGKRRSYEESCRQLTRY